MKTIYLIRHGDVEFPANEKMCISRTDLPLSTIGEAQGVSLREFFSRRPLSAVYCSDLRRSVRTAELLSGGRFPIYQNGAFSELSVGVWEGLSFRQIKAEWADVYDKRDSSSPDPPPGGETYSSGAARFLKALEPILPQEDACIAVVSHAGILRSAIASIQRLPPASVRGIAQPCGCISTIVSDGGTFSVRAIGQPPRRYPDAALCQCLFDQQHTPEAVRQHCRAVRVLALEMADELSSAGIQLDRELLSSAAELHDLARTQHRHPAVGQKILSGLGYSQVGDVIARHHDCDGSKLDEAAVLFLADKLVQGSKRVGLQERFETSSGKCRDSNARESHQRQFKQALHLQNLYLSLLETEEVQ